MSNRLALLRADALETQRWLNGFECQQRPVVGLEGSGQTLWIRNFPLPDSYRPDRVDLALVVRDYPVEPPKGLYLIHRPGNASLLEGLKCRFNIFQNQAFHGAPAIEGYEWICVGYLNGWRYNTATPARGDNIQKMLLEFWRLLEET